MEAPLTRGRSSRRAASFAARSACALALAAAVPLPALAQDNPAFDIRLSIDYTAAEQTLLLLRDEYVSTGQVSALRGNRIAAATTGLIAGSGDAEMHLKSYLDSLQAHQIIRDDVYRLEDARSNADAIAALLSGMQRRNFSRSVTATVEQIFPSDITVTATIPVYVVALGHENADAYVRRVSWKGDVPEFAGEDEGELTIIVNLAAGAAYPVEPEEKLSQILVTVAHEVFHAAFGLYKDASPFWKAYNAGHRTPADYLLDLVQNEGIAYYLSMEQRMGASLPREWSEKIGEAFTTFNANAERLLSGRLTRRETEEIIYSANLSGYWESYGSMVGMAMARAVDSELGRKALIETISLGPLDLLGKYRSVSEMNAGYPTISDRLLRAYRLK